MNKIKQLTKTERGLLFSGIMAAIHTEIAVVGFFVNSADITALVTLAGLWVTEFGAYVGFYCWKEKNANRQKYAMKWVREIKEEFPPEVAARFAEIVLKE